MSKIRQTAREVICALMGHVLGTRIPLSLGGWVCSRCGVAVRPKESRW